MRILEAQCDTKACRYFSPRAPSTSVWRDDEGETVTRTINTLETQESDALNVPMISASVPIQKVPSLLHIMLTPLWGSGFNTELPDPVLNRASIEAAYSRGTLRRNGIGLREQSVHKALAFLPDSLPKGFAWINGPD